MGDLASHGGGARQLAVAGLPRLVELPGDRTIQVRPPTLREAIELLAALSGAGEGDAGDAELVDEVLSEWLDDELIAFVGTLDREQITTMLHGLIFQGADLDRLRKQSEDAEKRAEDDDEDEDAGPLDWRLLLSDYCQVWSSDPWTVYNLTPFPFFLSMLAVVGTASARDLLRWAEIEVLPHAGKASQRAFESLKNRALDKAPDHDAAPASKKRIERDRARLKSQLGGGHRR